MKIERLYALTVYLLNHGRTSASKLAKYFEVSVRTIQRDIDSLCLSGIPVIAITGAAGGYEISDQFQLREHITTSGDYSYIMTALQGLVSATGDPRVKHALEKIANLSKPQDNGMILDFSVLREGEQSVLQLLQTAVSEKHAVSFTYTNNNNETRPHIVEPIALIYRWYAWYLLAYSRIKKDYRLYKLVRIDRLEMTKQPFEKEHEPAETILKKNDQTDSRQYTELLMKCKEPVRPRVMEYLKAMVIQELPNGDALMKAAVVDNEQFWFGTLLSLGDQVEVLAPENIRTRLLESAEKTIALYHKL